MLILIMSLVLFVSFGCSANKGVVMSIKISLVMIINELTGNIESRIVPAIAHDEVDRHMRENLKMPSDHLIGLCFHFAQQGVRIRLK